MGICDHTQASIEGATRGVNIHSPKIVCDFSRHVATEESFGLAVAEALARNLRLFAFRTGGIVDIATDLADATLIAPLDWPALSTALESWLHTGHPPARNTAQTMRQRYSSATIAAAHMAIYRELTG